MANGKEPAENTGAPGDVGSISRSGRCPGVGNVPCSMSLPGKFHGPEGTGGLWSMESQKRWT